MRPPWHCGYGRHIKDTSLATAGVEREKLGAEFRSAHQPHAVAAE
jgi:hypothetical protein